MLNKKSGRMFPVFIFAKGQKHATSWLCQVSENQEKDFHKLFNMVQMQ